MGKNSLSKIAAKFGAGVKKTKGYAEALDKATKLRFSAVDMELKIKYGFGVTKGLEGNKKYQKLSVEGKKRGLRIVDEECEKKLEWAPKELPGLARAIEKRLKKECS